MGHGFLSSSWWVSTLPSLLPYCPNPNKHLMHLLNFKSVSQSVSQWVSQLTDSSVHLFFHSFVQLFIYLFTILFLVVSVMNAYLFILPLFSALLSFKAGGQWFQFLWNYFEMTDFCVSDTVLCTYLCQIPGPDQIQVQAEQRRPTTRLHLWAWILIHQHWLWQSGLWHHTPPCVRCAVRHHILCVQSSPYAQIHLVQSCEDSVGTPRVPS